MVQFHRKAHGGRGSKIWISFTLAMTMAIFISFSFLLSVGWKQTHENEQLSHLKGKLLEEHLNGSFHIRFSRSELEKRSKGKPLVIPNNLIGCITEECIGKLAALLARIYPRKAHKESWCLPLRKSSQTYNGTWRGILMVKVPKGASSTSSGVALRLQDRLSCGPVQYVHRLASIFEHYDRGALLFTTIREPSKRALSTVFFHYISRSNLTRPSDQILIRLLTTKEDTHYGAISKGQGGFQLRYTSLSEIPPYSYWKPTSPGTIVNPERIVQNVQNTLNSYTIMLVTERMDESLVCMALLLGLDVADVLVTASKVSGSRFHFTRVSRNSTTCYPTVKSYQTRKVKELFESNQWRAMNYGDYLLHAAANKSLDLTIASLQPEFNVALERYRKLEHLASEQCSDSVKFPCSNEGEPQPNLSKESCYLPFYDFGCGYKCVDRVIREYDGHG